MERGVSDILQCGHAMRSFVSVIASTSISKYRVGVAMGMRLHRSQAMVLIGSLEGAPPRLRVVLTHLSVLSPSELESGPCVYVPSPVPQQAPCIDYLYLLPGEEARQ